MAIDFAAVYPSLTFDRPSDGILRITLDGPGLNAVSPDGHRELGEVWLDVDRDPDTRVAILRGAGKGFSAGGSFELRTAPGQGTTLLATFPLSGAQGSP